MTKEQETSPKQYIIAVSDCAGALIPLKVVTDAISGKTVALQDTIGTVYDTIEEAGQDYQKIGQYSYSADGQINGDFLIMFRPSERGVR